MNQKLISLNAVKTALARLAGLSLLAFSVSVVAAPPVPTLSTPYNGATNVSQSNVRFSWYSSGATSYRLVISQNSSFSGFRDVNGSSTCDSTCFTIATSSTSYTKNMDFSGQTYYWKVRANNSTGASSFSGYRYFTTAGTATAQKVWPLTSHSNIPFGVGSYNFGSYHTGIDIMTTLNTPVYAMCKGTVMLNKTNNPYSTAYDNYWNSFLIIKHDCNGDIIYGYYGHLSSTLATNSSVSANQVIGSIRMAKTTTGADYPGNNHLHFGLNKSYLSSGWGYASSLSAVTSLGWVNPKTYLP
ncbi:MAG: M23 family metallopeptidase [Methylovulum sp.]|nr:M23 family metallopeptidase [Methylovulum sp.]